LPLVERKAILEKLIVTAGVRQPAFKGLRG
jgi:hypothetical protein